MEDNFPDSVLQLSPMGVYFIIFNSRSSINTPLLIIPRTPKFQKINTGNPKGNTKNITVRII